MELSKQVSFALGHTAGSAGVQTQEPLTSEPSDFIPSGCVSLPPLPTLFWLPQPSWTMAFGLCLPGENSQVHRSPACPFPAGRSGEWLLIRGLRFERRCLRPGHWGHRMETLDASFNLAFSTMGSQQEGFQAGGWAETGLGLKCKLPRFPGLCSCQHSDPN